MSLKNSSTTPQNAMVSRKLKTCTGLATIAAAALLVGMISTPAFASTPSAPIKLLSAAPFSVLAGAAATLPGSTLPGQVGAAAAITDDAGTHYGVGKHAVNDAATVHALSDLRTDYANLSGLAATGTLTGDDLAGQTITPGVYHRVAALAMTTPVTFDARGDSSANFVIQSDAALNTTASTTMNLINGAQASHIFWVTRGAATLGASSHFFGTMVSNAAITVGATSTVCGRALSVTAAVTLDADVFSCAAAADESLRTISIDGAPHQTATTHTPKISGETNAPSGSTVTVKVGTKTYTTTSNSSGEWKITTSWIANGTVNVVATVDGGTVAATETLTIRCPR